MQDHAGLPLRLYNLSLLTESDLREGENGRSFQVTDCSAARPAVGETFITFSLHYEFKNKKENLPKKNINVFGLFKLFIVFQFQKRLLYRITTIKKIKFCKKNLRISTLFWIIFFFTNIVLNTISIKRLLNIRTVKWALYFELVIENSICESINWIIEQSRNIDTNIWTNWFDISFLRKF